ncbi:DUF1847 domain-containing protein [Chloroflexota bacterium]
MSEKTECAKCTMPACGSKNPDQGMSNCPTKTKQGVIKQAITEYNRPDINELYRQSCIQTSEVYVNLPEGRTPCRPRVEEVVQLAKKMGYKKLGIAFCSGLKAETKLLTPILENRGFDVVSVCCKCGFITKETIGFKDEQKMSESGTAKLICNPISQAEILNGEGTDFNIVVGLCVGHDSLFLKYAQAPTTVLIVKDRVFGHNPVAALYQSHSYHRKLLRKESD